VNARGLAPNVDQESALAGGQHGAGGDSQTNGGIAFLLRQLDPLESSQFPHAKGDQGPSDIEPEAENPSFAPPVRGWLLVLSSYLICVPLLETFDIARQNFDLWSPPPEMISGLYPILVARIIWIITAIPAFMFMVYAGVGLLGKWRHSVKIAKISLVAEMIVSFFNSTAIGVLRAITDTTGLAHGSILSPETWLSFSAVAFMGFRFLLSTLHALYYVLPNLIALAYLQKSRRVRLTYPGG
jgi:hypothetical protein